MDLRELKMKKLRCQREYMLEPARYSQLKIQGTIMHPDHGKQYSRIAKLDKCSEGV